MFSRLAGRKVIFITTKSTDYIRNRQEINMLTDSQAILTVIGSTYKHYPARLINVFRRLLFTDLHEYDAIVIGFAPQLIIPLFFRKIRSSGADVIIDFFISMYDTLCHDRRCFRPQSPIGKFLHKLDTYTLSRAGEVICDTNAHKNYFVEEFHVSPKKCHVLYLEADHSIFYPIETSRPQSLTGKALILYFGTGLPLQGTDIVLEAYSKLSDYDNIHTIFIGHPVSKREKDIIASTSNLTHIEWLPQDKLNEYINMADLCIAGHFNKSIAKASRTIPGKAYIYDATNKPMILGDNPANHEQFDPSDKYIYVPMGDADALTNTILEYLGYAVLNRDES